MFLMLFVYRPFDLLCYPMLQNVLLYNFFSSSPLKNQWRIVYQYMKEQHLLDSTLPDSLASLKTQTTHDLMPFELKLLYLAITRSTQRLWIYENREYNSSPIFEYWKTLSLVQIKELDDSLLKAMQVECNKEEWSSRGILVCVPFAWALDPFYLLGTLHFIDYIKYLDFKCSN